MDPQPERLALVEEPEPLSIAALYRQVQAAVAASFPRGHLQWVRGEIQSISRPHRALLHGPRRPRRRRGARHPGAEGQLLGQDLGPAQERRWLVRGSSSSPARSCPCGAGSSSTPPRARSISSPPTSTSPPCSAGWRRAGRRCSTPSRPRGSCVATRPWRCPSRAPAHRPRGQPGLRGLQRLRRPAAGVGPRLLRGPVPSQRPGSRGTRRRSPGRCAPWPAPTATSAVLVRGGGSRGDLAAFDAEPVARAIATLPIPLWTGIGHTGDQSVADIVANRAFVTPTACAQELVRRVGEWWDAIARSGARVGRRAVDSARGGDVAATPRPGAAWARPRATSCPGTPSASSGGWPRSRPTPAASSSRGRRRGAPGGAPRPRGAGASSTATRTRLATWRRLLAAYDIERQLERGYTITCGPTAPWCAR